MLILNRISFHAIMRLIDRRLLCVNRLVHVRWPDARVGHSSQTGSNTR